MVKLRFALFRRLVGWAIEMYKYHKDYLFSMAAPHTAIDAHVDGPPILDN